MQAFSAISGGDSKGHRNDDDIGDRMIYKATVFVLIVLTAFAVTHPVVADNISCWTPAHFKGAWSDYTNQYCWARSTYSLPMETPIPRREEVEKRNYMSYYQWVPYVMLALIGSCLLPIGIWRAWNTGYGIDVNNVMECSEKFTQILHNDTKTVELYEAFVVTSFQRFFAFGRGRFKFSLTLLYAVVKVLFIATIILQMVALSAFLGDGFYSYGINVITALTTSADWPQLPSFPRVTMCDFNVRLMGSVQRYTVQCALTLNLYYEKIFFFIWLWLITVLQFQVYRTVVWLTNLSSLCRRQAYIASRLKNYDEGMLIRFVYDYLRLDGCFLLQLIEHNTDDLTVRNIITKLYEAYNDDQTSSLPNKTASTENKVNDYFNREPYAAKPGDQPLRFVDTEPLANAAQKDRISLRQRNRSPARASRQDDYMEPKKKRLSDDSDEYAPPIKPSAPNLNETEL